jgi:hypothetical protein
MGTALGRRASTAATDGAPVGWAVSPALTAGGAVPVAAVSGAAPSGGATAAGALATGAAE